MARTEKVKAAQIQASYADGKLLVFAQGEMKDLCVKSIRIVRSQLAVEPLKFTIERVLADGQNCGAAITPWTHFDVFNIGPYRKRIKVEDASGDHDILVSWMEPFNNTEIVPMGGGGEIPVPFFTVGSGVKRGIGIAEVVGYSNAMSFDEAFRDALKNLPPDQSGYPDELKSYLVTSISAEFGGIAGMKRMRVAISGVVGGL